MGTRLGTDLAGGGSAVLEQLLAQGPSAFGGLLRNWWRAADYVAATGTWAAAAGFMRATLVQGNASKRPAKTATNADFGNKPTVDADGVDDDFTLANQFGMSLQPNTVGILFKTTGNVAGDYLVGQYAASSYQFYRADEGTDTFYTDPSNQSYASAGVGATHLWLASKSGTTLTAFKDGVSLGNKTMTSSSGAASNFHVFSAGGGYCKASMAELFTIDRAITPSEAALLSAYFLADGYPL